MEDRARHVDKRIVELTTRAKSDFIECGMLVAEVEEKMLWRYIVDPSNGFPFNSFAEWAAWRLSYGRASYMEAKRVVREFQRIPRRDLESIQRCNFRHLRRVPERLRTPEIIDAAKGPEDSFVRRIQRDMPGLLIEHRHTLSFRLDDSQKRLIDSALQKMIEEMREQGEVPSREEALEMICNHYLNGE